MPKVNVPNDEGANNQLKKGVEFFWDNRDQGTSHEGV